MKDEVIEVKFAVLNLIGEGFYLKDRLKWIEIGESFIEFVLERGIFGN